MEEEKVTQTEEEKQPKKKPKTFTLFQSILLLFLSFAFTSGTGYALGHFYFWNDLDMKRVNEQLDYYKEKVRIDPGNLENRVVLGYTYFLKGQNEKAIKEFDYVLDQDDKYYDAYYNLGLVYLDEERFNDALLMFNKTVNIAPKDYKGHVQLGITYRNLNMFDDATKALETANQLNPANSDIIYQIGLVAEAKGDLKAAADIYKDALQYDPLFEDASNALDRLNDENGTEGE
jgi:tetratricopeptide (TPR) repeat protein